MNLREEIYQSLNNIGDWDRIVNWGYVNPEFSLSDEVTKILKIIEKHIDSISKPIDLDSNSEFKAGYLYALQQVRNDLLIESSG